MVLFGLFPILYWKACDSRPENTSSWMFRVGTQDINAKAELDPDIYRTVNQEGELPEPEDLDMLNGSG